MTEKQVPNKKETCLPPCSFVCSITNRIGTMNACSKGNIDEYIMIEDNRFTDLSINELQKKIENSTIHYVYFFLAHIYSENVV